MLHRRRGYEHLVVQRLHLQAGIHKQVGKQGTVLVLKGRAQLKGSGSRIDLVVGSGELAGSNLFRHLPVPGFDRQLAAMLHLGDNFVQIVFRQSENHRDWLDLRDHQQGGCSIRGDQISGIDQAKPNPAIDGRSNVAIGHLHLVILQGALIVLDGALILQDEFFLVFESLSRNGVALPGVLIALQIHLGFRQQILIALQSTLRLHHLRLIGSGVEIDQRVTLMNQLTFAIMHCRDDAGDLRGNRIGVDRGNGADRLQVHADAAQLGSSRGDRYRAEHGVTAAGLRGRRSSRSVPQDYVKQSGEQQQNHDPDPAVAPLRGRAGSGGRQQVIRWDVNVVLL